MKKNYHYLIVKNAVLVAVLFLLPHISFAQPANDNCVNATSLTNFSGATCGSTTAGTVVLATNSLVAAGTCGGTPDDDVWYRFNSIDGPLVTITVNGIGSNLSTSGTRVELFSGTCGSLSFITCAGGTGGGPITITAALPAGNTYFIRVYSAGAVPIATNGSFNICVRTAVPPTPSTVATGKSFINITRPGGGAVNPGDELEIRVSVNVSLNGTRIYRTRYNDTIPANLNYVPGSMKVLTNEGKTYKSFTDAAGDDQGFYNAATRTVRFNLGRDTTGHTVGILSSTGIDTTIGGGYFNPQTHFPRANGVLMIVTYRVIVDPAVSYNTIYNYGPGALRYRNQISSVGTIDYEQFPNSLMFIVYPTMDCVQMLQVQIM